jgi:hypothetical protein
MNSVRRSFASIGAVALAVGLVTGLAAGPAAAGGGFPPPVFNPGGGGQTGTGSASGGAFTANAAERVALSGDSTGVIDYSLWTPPECWLQPVFNQPQTYAAGDPTGGPTDAASFYFWFGDNFQYFRALTGHVPDARQLILQEFQQEQKGQRPAGWTGPDPITSSDVWWGPQWLNNAQGTQCALAMVVGDGLSDGYVGMMPPATPGAGGGDGQISNQDLADLAYAALRLPKMTIVTSPPVRTEVNIPTYVGIEYEDGIVNPQDRATVYLDGVPWLWAQVTTKLDNVQISSDAPGYQTTSSAPCEATGAGKATPACSITFDAPSGAAPYTITVTATWTVSWATSAGDGGTFTPNPSKSATRTITVREIQSQT